MKIYYYVHTGHRTGLDRFRRACTIIRALGDVDITLLCSDFRIANEARHFGVSKSTYQWWKEHKIIKINQLNKVNIKFSQEELKKLSRYSEPTSLLLADIDFFKKINDTYGHPSGDLVLKEVSNIIREAIRDIDMPARYGGEEFAAILPRTDSKGAMNIAERLRKAVMSASFSSDTSQLKVTLSIGIATTPSDAKTKEELIEKADEALYYAKHNGRNRSVLWNEIKN